MKFPQSGCRWILVAIGSVALSVSMRVLVRGSIPIPGPIAAPTEEAGLHLFLDNWHKLNKIDVNSEGLAEEPGGSRQCRSASGGLFLRAYSGRAAPVKEVGS